MHLRFLAIIAALSVLVLGCSPSETAATLGELDRVASRAIPSSSVLGTSVAAASLPDV